MSPRRRALLVVTAALAVVLVAVVGLRWLLHRGSVAADQGRPGPVLLVSGYGGGTGDLTLLARALRAAGRTVEVVPAVDGGTGDLTDQARALGAVADRVTAAGAPSVDVVGYSAGGVVARVWAAQLDGARLARRIVTLGSPHHGTQVAALAAGLAGSCPTACRQLATGSPLLSGLPDTVAGPVWASVWTRADTVVVPPDSARLTGAADVVLQDLCPDAGTGHGGLPTDPLVLGLVDRLLDGPARTGPPGPADCTALRTRGTTLAAGPPSG